MSKALTSTERSRKQREKDKKMGVERMECRLSKEERKKANMAMNIRGGLEPYTFDEYVATLILKDFEELKRLRGRVKECGHCNKNPVETKGCDGIFKGDARCYWHSRYKELML